MTSSWSKAWKTFWRYKALFLMLVPGVVYLIINNYLPMFGLTIAFKDIKYAKGIWRSDWIGFKNFEFLFMTKDAWRITRNTILYNAVFIVLNTATAIAVAIMLNEVRKKFMARFYQSVLLLPYLISMVIVGYLVLSLLNVENGFVNKIILPAFGIDPIAWYSRAEFWPYILTIVNLWKNIGYLCIIYLAAIVGIDQEYYEAAMIDGASKWQQIRSITVPLLMPTIIILTLLKKNKFALLSLLMAIMLLVSACGGSGNSGGSQQNAGDNAQTSSGGEGPAKVVMAYLVFTDVTDIDLVEEEINKIAREKINVEVELMPLDAASWQQQVNLLLAGNEKLDLIMTSSMMGYSTQVSRGQLIELDDLLEQYAPEIKNTMPEAIYNGTRINGKIYGIPSIRDFGADYGMVMRKDLVDKYNIDLSKVKTWRDLTDVFKVIKENEPNIAPLVASGQAGQPVNYMIPPVIDSLGDGLGVIKLDDPEMKVVNKYALDEYRELVELVREWYEAGYILPDTATTQEAGINLVKSGKGFGYFNNLKPGYAEQESMLTNHEMVAVSLSDVIIQSSGATSFMMSIARNSTDPAAAMKFLNLLYTDADVINLLANGIEGKHYVIKEDGQITRPEGVTETGYQFNQWEIGNNFLTLVWDNQAPDIWEKMKAHNESGIVSPALGFTFDQSPVKSEVAAVTNVLDEYKIGVESGTLEVEMLDKFIQELENAGIDRIIAEKQKQLDEWAIANGKK